MLTNSSSRRRVYRCPYRILRESRFTGSPMPMKAAKGRSSLGPASHVPPPEHSPRAIQAWAERLRERFKSAPIAVSLELAQGPIVSALLEHDFFVLFPVQPAMLARYRLAFTPSRAKDDPTDAELALEVLLRHP